MFWTNDSAAYLYQATTRKNIVLTDIMCLIMLIVVNVNEVGCPYRWNSNKAYK